MFCIIKKLKIISVYRNLYKTKLIKEIMEESNEHHEPAINHNHVENRSKRHSSNRIWIVATIILAALLILVLFTGFSFTGQVTKNSVEKNFLNFANAAGVTATINNIETFGANLYVINASINGQEGVLYVTKDGKYLTSYVSSMTVSKETTSEPEETTTEVVKSDKPIVELFVMTHCPYGTQAEKGFIPAIQNLGSTIDAKVRFVHYFMHGDKEEQETYNQVCIREEQSAKYLSYLSCFLEDGNSTRCISKIGIDQKKLNTCLANDYTKAKEYYAVDSQLSEKYGVQGSPTLVINGVQISTARDAASMLDAICTTFTTAPESCGVKLSTASPSSGFGTGTASSASSAQC